MFSPKMLTAPIAPDLANSKIPQSAKNAEQSSTQIKNVNYKKVCTVTLALGVTAITVMGIFKLYFRDRDLKKENRLQQKTNDDLKTQLIELQKELKQIIRENKIKRDSIRKIKEEASRLKEALRDEQESSDNLTVLSGNTNNKEDMLSEFSSVPSTNNGASKRLDKQKKLALELGEKLKHANSKLQFLEGKVERLNLFTQTISTD